MRQESENPVAKRIRDGLRIETLSYDGAGYVELAETPTAKRLTPTKPAAACRGGQAQVRASSLADVPLTPRFGLSSRPMRPVGASLGLVRRRCRVRERFLCCLWP